MPVAVPETPCNAAASFSLAVFSVAEEGILFLDDEGVLLPARVKGVLFLTNLLIWLKVGGVILLVEKDVRLPALLQFKEGVLHLGRGTPSVVKWHRGL